ncbi:hypothetical protein [Sphingobacterium chuzhouense]|uniref:Uncharacterized protein n=1 Tax=Sphingobacterium chuzhouense TaxID=1742264 RepID=A0ABR7XRM9_9SPHI|nr:hypothetical protein [Sphingobacterium chuzhouense]MBD1421803.1 hypothetical protein [Sphingobacterium chuzhouense]
MKKYIIIFIGTFSLFTNCGSKENAEIPINPPGEDKETVDLLWNQGVKKKNYTHMNSHDRGRQPSLCAVSDLSELIPGKPSNVNETYACLEGGSIAATDRSAPSVHLVSINCDGHEYIYDYPNSTRKTGFAFNPKRENPDDPIEFQFVNLASGYTNADSLKYLREVGLVFSNWGKSNTGNWAFKRDFTIGEFDKDIQLKFFAKLDHVNKPNANNNIYITCDLRYVFWNGNQKVRADLVGVLVYENLANPSNPDPVYWKSSSNVGSDPSERWFIRGARTQVPQLTSEWKEITINFNKFIEMLPDPPAGVSYDDAVISGFDLYSSMRGQDVVFSVKDVRLVGYKPTNK